uniref:Ig-like domain-containing protein n=1 Tax=Myotis lucifugus TaxID=59463 RepID=G1Q4C5_MYOLU
MTPTLRVLLCLAGTEGGNVLNPDTGFFPGPLPKPTIRAEPGPVIPLGSPMTIWCQGTPGAEEHLLYKEGRPQPWKRPELLELGDSAKFSITHMTEQDAGRYCCYYRSPAGWSEPSDPLELLVPGESHYCPIYGLRHLRWESEGSTRAPGPKTQRETVRPGGQARRRGLWASSPYNSCLVSPGESREPSLLSQQGPIVNLTLKFRSDVGYDRLALHKEGRRDLPQSPQAGLSQAHFPLDTVSSSHRGRYRCYGGYNLSSEWSAPSDPLDILVARHLLDRPSLSVQPGPRVASGENVTLLCHSQSPRDTFLLCKERAAGPPLRLISKYRAGQYQAEFSTSPVTSAHGGTYRCYSSNGTSPFLLSLPSESLELQVSG